MQTIISHSLGNRSVLPGWHIVFGSGDTPGLLQSHAGMPRGFKPSFLKVDSLEHTGEAVAGLPVEGFSQLAQPHRHISPSQHGIFSAFKQPDPERGSPLFPGTQHGNTALFPIKHIEISGGFKYCKQTSTVQPALMVTVFVSGQVG
jgi:hypothetical protein